MIEGRAAIAAAVAADLVDRLGRARVLQGEDARRHCGLDPQGRDGPLAVALAATSDHVEAVVRVGKLRHAAVLPRLRWPVAQADEVKDALVVDLTGLQRPPAVDIGRQTVTVGAGVAVGLVDRCARQARLCLRGLPALDGHQPVGLLVAKGDPGELGSGPGGLCDDVVGVEVVTGGGRVLRLAAADLFNGAPWLAAGLGQPLGQVVGSEGRLAIVCEVTLRLHPAPEVAWTGLDLAPDRGALLTAASLARALLSAQVADTVLVSESGEGQRLAIRLCSWRSDDGPAVAALALQLAQRLGLALPKPVAESKRVRLGMDLGAWPQHQPHRAGIDWRVSWPELPGVCDLTSALYAEAGERPDRLWAFGSTGVRLRCHLAGRAETHPLVTRAALLLEAGAVPVGVGSLLRGAARDHLATGTKVLLAGLQRAWDPEAVLAARTGVV